MRHITDPEGYGITYPDNICFAREHNYIQTNMGDTLTITIGGDSYELYRFNGIFPLDELLRSAFPLVNAPRYVTATFFISYADSDAPYGKSQTYSIDFIVNGKEYPRHNAPAARPTIVLYDETHIAEVLLPNVPSETAEYATISFISPAGAENTYTPSRLPMNGCFLRINTEDTPPQIGATRLRVYWEDPQLSEIFDYTFPLEVLPICDTRTRLTWIDAHGARCEGFFFIKQHSTEVELVEELHGIKTADLSAIPVTSRTATDKVELYTRQLNAAAFDFFASLATGHDIVLSSSVTGDDDMPVNVEDMTIERIGKNLRAFRCTVYSKEQLYG